VMDYNKHPIEHLYICVKNHCVTAISLYKWNLGWGSSIESNLANPLPSWKDAQLFQREREPWKQSWNTLNRHSQSNPYWLTAGFLIG
jgi:hypothetical protein